MESGPIFVGIGSNLSSERYGPPLAVAGAAIIRLRESQILVSRRSRWYRTAPVPPSDQPPFVNGVIEVRTALGPEALLSALLNTETLFGRVRSTANAARVLDLDLLAYGPLVRDERPPLLPHPRLHERAFVLVPLADLAPDWRHPRLGRSVREMLSALPAGEWVEPLQDEAGDPNARILDELAGNGLSVGGRGP